MDQKYLKVNVEEGNQGRETDKTAVYKEDVKEMVFRRRSDIADLNEKLAKYQDKVEGEILDLQSEIKMLDRVAETLPPRPAGPLFEPENETQNPLPQPLDVEKEDS
jgi:predicted  nucleic acid-binding Zn-ribbon protein